MQNTPFGFILPNGVFICGSLFLHQINFPVRFFKITNVFIDQEHNLAAGRAVVIFCHAMKFSKRCFVNADTDVFLFIHKFARFHLKCTNYMFILSETYDIMARKH